MQRHLPGTWGRVAGGFGTQVAGVASYFLLALCRRRSWLSFARRLARCVTRGLFHASMP